MSSDLGPILQDWPYEPGQITVRKIRGQDGRAKIQLRVDLGVLQMETTGRPDGQRPYGFESVMAYVGDLLARHRQTYGSDAGFTLDEKHCEMLRAEAAQYYYRYLSEHVLEDYEAVERDTRRNLRVLDLCTRYARERSDRHVLERYRPYILMMNAQARCRLALRDSRPRAARRIAAAAIEAVGKHYRQYGREEAFEHSSEVATLRALLKEAEAKIPADPLTDLRRDLERAIEEERYEDAASLRDAIERAQEDSDD